MGNLKEFKVTEEKLVAADEKAKAKRLEKTGRTWPHLPYSTAEDEEILEYIVDEQQYSRVGGHELFKEMVAQKVVDGRSWVSLRDRFRCHIRKNLQTYSILTDDQRTFLRERTVILDEEGKLAAGQTKLQQKFTVAEEKAILEFIIQKKAYSRVGSKALFKEMAAEGVGVGRTWSSLNEHFRKHMIKKIDSYGLTSEQVSFFKNKTVVEDADAYVEEQIAAGKKRSNQRYSGTEDVMILQHIVSKKAYNKVAGDQLWKNMEKAKVAGDRTWRSMKARFGRTLIKAIENKKKTYNLQEDQISFFINRGKIGDGAEEEEESSVEDGDDEEEMDDEEGEDDVEQMDEDTTRLEEEDVDEADMEEGEEEEIEEFQPARIRVDF